MANHQTNSSDVGTDPDLPPATNQKLQRKRAEQDRDTAVSSPQTIASPVANSVESESTLSQTSRQGPADVRRRGVTLAGGVGVLLALIAFIVGARLSGDNSFMTHLATGRLVLDEGAVPTADPYSYTAKGDPWVVQSWLPSIVYATSERLLGLASIRVLNGLLAAAIAVGLWRLTDSAKQITTRVGLMIPPLILGFGFWSQRPLMFGLLAMVLTLHVVQSRMPIWAMIPIMWFWVNSHGSFPMAFALLGAVMVGTALDSRQLPKREVGVLVFAVLGCAVGALNPVGPRLLVFPFQLLAKGDALRQVSEWSSPEFRRPLEWTFLILLGLVVAAASRGAGWRVLLPALGFFVGGLLAIRNMSVASLVITAMIVPVFAGLYGSDDGSGTGFVGKALGLSGVFGILIGSLATLAGPGLAVAHYPESEVEYLEDRTLVATSDVSLLHRERVGNYLEYRYGDDANVFFDDRFDMYPLSIVEDSVALVQGKGDFEEIVDRWSPDIVIWEVDSDFGRWLQGSNDWEVIDLDKEDRWLLACNRSSTVYATCAE